MPVKDNKGWKWIDKDSPARRWRGGPDDSVEGDDEDEILMKRLSRRDNDGNIG